MESSTPTKSRLQAVDALRGLVMIIMALDHTRDFFHSGAMSFPPEDLARTTPALFFTRWITHFCAPVFMFAAGMGAFLWLQRNNSKGQLSRFLWTRGLWLVVLELTVMRLAFYFNFDPGLPIIFLVLCALGGSMIALAALVHLPIRALAALSVAVIALHNCLDGIQASQFGRMAWIWNLIHQPGAIPLGGTVIFVGYPLIPWIAVMAAGFCFGQVFLLEPPARRRIFVRLGFALTFGFVVMRTLNVYGDPVPWSRQSSGVFTLLSFLRSTKYPPSLDFLLMTIGPALLVLAYFDRCRLKASNPLLVFGRTPLFYFIVHFFSIHALLVLLTWLRYGNAPFLFLPLPQLGGSRQLFPPDFGYSLWVVYAVWIGIVALMYPLCRWFAQLKARRKDWWLSYL